MEIKTSDFVKSAANPSQCPAPDKPEYAFIGRSNVGKSSLINLLCERKALAKISGKPGKTQLINHFIINEEWYLVDLPGYGYAKVSKKERVKWKGFTYDYLKTRTNLCCVFVLIDSRIPPQKIDLEFMEWLGRNNLPFVMVFTKIDKLSSRELHKNLQDYQRKMLETWERFPKHICTSTVSRFGREDVLSFVAETNPVFNHAYRSGFLD